MTVCSEVKETTSSEIMIAPNQKQATLSSNTGYDSQNRSGSAFHNFSCKIDWLDITCRAIAGPKEAYEVVDFLETLTGEHMYFSTNNSAFNGISWDGSGKSKTGIMLWYRGQSVSETGEYVLATLKIAFPGSVLTPQVTESLLKWLSIMAPEYEIDATRVDIALDDHEKLVKLGKIEDARKGGNFFNCSYTERVTSSMRGESEGVTLYFGARSSDKRLRIYDKTLESKGIIKGNRWEAQYRRKAATEAFEYWLDSYRRSPKTVSTALARLVLGIIDFRKRDDDDTDRNRCQPLEWFSSLIVAVNAAPFRIVIKPKEKSMQRSINWVNRSVASTLAMIKISLSDEFMPYIERMVTEGAAKLNNIRREIAYTTTQQELLY